MAAAINIIGHGTDGSDGIARGIHLRWAFNDKLGFPDCIRLFRRESDLRDRYVLRPPGDEAARELKLPYKQKAQGRKAITFTIEYADRDGKKLSSVPTTRIELDAGTLYLQPHDGMVRITLSRPVPRIILGFVLRPDTAFAVEAEGARPYQPLHMGAGKNVPEMLEFEGDAIKRIRLTGEQIVLVGLTAWDCVRDNGNPWQEIKLNCGCGLPVDIKKPTNYIGDVYNQIKDPDFATVLCRLGIGQTEKAPFTRAAFAEFRQTLRAIGREGSSVPVGWTRFPSDADGGAGDVGLELAQYDYLLVQSQLAATARVLDLAYLDDQVDAAKAYDYRVETSWPEDHNRRLDHVLTFEDQEAGQALAAVVPHRDELAIGGMVDGRFEALDHPGARSTRALTFDCTAGLTGIQFVQPVTEVQIWLAHGEEGSSAEITVSAFAPNFITAFETISVTRERQFLRIEAPAIAAIRFAGARVAISRLHYDREPFPHGSQSAQTCGLRILRQHPLEPPRDLQVAALPGGPVMVEGRGRVEKPQLAGLRWAGHTDRRLAMLSIHPVAYHIERQDRSGRIGRLTEGKPLLLGLDVAGPQTRPLPQGWPGRPYYVDPGTRNGQAYRVAALDIFGRLSAFSAPVTYTPEPAALATPRDVRARYLDPAAYDAASDQLLDPLLTEADRDWLRDDGRAAIRVSWTWPAEIPAPQRDAQRFRIVFQEGWLNVTRGIVDATVAVSETTVPLVNLALTAADRQRLPVLATLPAAVPALQFRGRMERVMAAGELRLAWLKQGAKAFLVLTNGAGLNVTIRVLAMEAPAAAAVEPDQGFAVTLTADSAAFIDYALAPSWTDRRVGANIRRQNNGQVDYEHLIPAPLFPDPPIGVADLETIRYGQVGVYATRGATESAVSVPATVMAVRRQAPQAAALPYDGGTALRASPADIHGKARFALRWPKLGESTRHHVFRAMDESLFAVDRAAGGTGDYAAMSPNALQALTSRPDYAGAFTQLTQQPLAEDDPAYADRIALPEEQLAQPPYQPDPALMLYVDASLDGRSRNRYFYRLQAVDSGGLAGALGAATPPVEIPRTALPPAPVLTAVEGGDRRITLRWVAQPASSTAGYLVYRSDDPAADDWRRMTKVAGSGPNGLVTPDELAVAADGSLEFIDTTVVPRQATSYRVLAVGLDTAGKWLRSRPSVARSGQAFDLTPPAPPVITSVSRQGPEIVVAWTCEEALACMIQRRAEGAAIATSSPWLEGGVLDEADGLWHFSHVDNGALNPEQSYVITVQGRSAAGNVATSTPSEPV